MFCKKCGKELKDGYKFCPQCGTTAPRLDTQFVQLLDMNGLIKKAERGDVAAIKRLAFRYQFGIGIKEDYEKAKKLYDRIGGEEHAFGSGSISMEESPFISINDVESKCLGSLQAAAYNFLWYRGPKSLSELKLLLKKFSYEHCNDIEAERSIALLIDNDVITEGDGFLFIIDPNRLTLSEIAELLLDYACKIAVAKNERKTESELKEIDVTYNQKINSLRQKYPELLCFWDLNNMKDEAIRENFESLKRKTKYNYSIPSLPTLNREFVDICGRKISIPLFCKIDDNTIVNSHIMPDYKIGNSLLISSNMPDHMDLNIMLLQLLLLLPIKKVKINIIDLDEEYKEDFFMKNINPQLYNGQPITTEKKLLELIERLEKRKEIVVREYRDYACWCQENKDIPIPYEFIIESSSLEGLSPSLADRYKKLFMKSSKMGAYKINISKVKISEGLKIGRHYFFANKLPNDKIVTACVKYINDCLAEADEIEILSQDNTALFNPEYRDDFETLTMPVGQKRNQEIQFRMDLVSHVHSFIIGQSGSGKSVLLHNILGAAMLEYAPEDLQFYLLDFKLGGVEFNRYKDMPHVKALLVDNSDPSITLEILRELRDRMAERGKLMRDAGVNNIAEYNKDHPGSKMPQILLVADECHELFKMDSSVPRVVSNEISEIVIKIAKEGRNQGVHLIFATQTLSGTEITGEIINNISDFYLLKCAATDSERLVPGSSNKTNKLSTGQIYYHHHVEGHSTFQAYYADRGDAAHLVELIRKKAEGHKHNGCFYFSGSQIFSLEDALRKQMSNANGNVPVLFMGRSIDLGQRDVSIRLMEDFSENVLLLGLNNGEQVTRTTMNMFVSLIYWSQIKKKEIAFDVIDCLNNDEGLYHDLLLQLADAGYCNIIARRDRSSYFLNLAQSINDGKATDTILLILGQDRFRELKMDMELNDTNDNNSEGLMSLSDDLFGSSNHSKVSTYREALDVILDKGPDYGVHTLMQLEKISNFLFADFVTPKMVYQKFKHLVMLRSEETTATTLRLQDNIRLEKLSSESERLRAYYYSEESDTYTLLTPYYIENEVNIVNLLKDN